MSLDDAASAPTPEQTAGRSLGRSLAMAGAVGAAGFAIGLALVAVPLFALAAFAEPGSGLERPFVRIGLSRVAVPVGVLVGVLSAITVGRWYHRGGRLPEPPPPSRADS